MSSPDRVFDTPLISASNAVLVIDARTIIAAPAATILSTLLDTSSYPTWNTFCPRVTIRSQPSTSSSSSDPILKKDTRYTMHVIMDPSKPSKTQDTAVVVTEIESEDAVKRVCWAMDGAASGVVGYGLRTERVHEIKEQGDGTCEVATWECMAGPLAYTVKWLYATRLKEAFAQWLADLKTHVEK